MHGLEGDCWMWKHRWPELRRRIERDPTVLLPVGSVEQHGVHLPCGVDALAGMHVAHDAAERTGKLVAAPLWYGYAPQHMSYPGTITLRPETLQAVVADVLTSLLWQGVQKIVIVNGHRMANLPPLQMAANAVAHRHGAYVGIVDPVLIGRDYYFELLSDTSLGGAAHADAIETALMLHLYPELVDMAALDTDPGETPKAAHTPLPYAIESPFEAGPRVLQTTPIPWREWAAGTGSGGNPSSATADLGREYHERMVELTCAYLAELDQLVLPSFEPPTRPPL